MTTRAADSMPDLPKPSKYDEWAGSPAYYTVDQMHQYARDYAAALSQTAGVAEGWALVPIKITDEMRDAWASSAADDACRYHADDETVTRFAQGAWDAMLAAAPAASGGERVPLSERLYRGPEHDPSGSERGMEPQATSESMPPSAASVSERARELPGDLQWKIDTLNPSSCGVVSLSQEEWAFVRQALTQQRGAEPIAWCDPTNPHRDSAFSWPGTSRSVMHTTPLFTTLQPSADAVRELVQRILDWQPLTSINKADRLYQILVAAGLPFERVTDELESLLGRGG